MLDPPSAAHADALVEAWCLREMGWRVEDQARVTDAEYQLRIDAWIYLARRRGYVEDYAARYRRWQAGLK